jgi:hypothetical protein
METSLESFKYRLIHRIEASPVLVQYAQIVIRRLAIPQALAELVDLRFAEPGHALRITSRKPRHL